MFENIWINLAISLVGSLPIAGLFAYEYFFEFTGDDQIDQLSREYAKQKGITCFIGCSIILFINLCLQNLKFSKG